MSHEEGIVSKLAAASPVARGVLGLLMGGGGGALLGALVFIFLTGWDEYTQNLSDTSSGWGGTQAEFTRRVTLVFALLGAAVCGTFGLIAGLLYGAGEPTDAAGDLDSADSAAPDFYGRRS